MTPAFILGLGENGYGILRSLTREGVRALGFHTAAQEFGRYSKYCETHFLPPSLNDAQISRVLIERARHFGAKPVLFATSDYHTSVLAKHREELSPYFQFHWVGTDDLRRIVDKARISRVCQEAGVLAPRTHVTRRDEKLAGLAEGWSFPCLIKPNRGFDTPWPAHLKNFIVRSPEELRAFYRAHPELRGETIFQEIIEGGDDEIFQCTALIRTSGEAGAVFCTRKLHQYRPGYGVMCFGRSEENQVVATQALRMLDALQYRGLASLEFKRRAKDGRYYFIEMNPRLPWYSALFVEAGLNLPYLAYLDLTGASRSSRSVPRQRDGVHWMNFEYNLGWLARTATKRRVRLLAWLRSVAQARSYAWFDWRDPQPFLRAMMNAFGRAFQKAQAFHQFFSRNDSRAVSHQ